MSKVTGTFYGESRVFAYPLLDFNNVPPLTPTTPTVGGDQAALQLTNEGGEDGSSWRIFGHSAVMCTPDQNGLPELTPVNLQIQRQDTQQLWVGSSATNSQPQNNADLGAPLEHLAGKAGMPGFFSYAKSVPYGTRLIPKVAHQAATTPTGRTPLYLVAHAALSRGGAGAQKMQIGSRNFQQLKYRGEWIYYTARLPYSAAAPLAVNTGASITLPIAVRQYFFIDSLWCRAVKITEEEPNIFLPYSSSNPQVFEDEILVSLRDTTQRSPFTVPGFVPLWSVFGPWAARYFHPPTCFVVRPNGNLEIDVQNGPTAAVEYNLEFTIGGVLVDKPDTQIVEQLQGA
jgi:hypothetical protein